jgi:hypothetical protein
MLHRLLRNDVEVIDLHTAFRDFRNAHPDSERLYYARDSHWMNRGAREAARLIAERLQRYPFVQQAMARENPFHTRPFKRMEGSKTDLDVQLVLQGGDRPYRDAAAAPVIVAGDSFQGYNTHIKAHCSAHVAYGIRMPVTLFTSAGLSSDIPLRVARDPHLDKRKVVVMSFNEKILSITKGDWPLVPLPAAAAAAAAASTTAVTAVTNVRATGIVRLVSERPDPKGTYPHYLMKVYVTDLATADGAKLGSGDGVILVLAMHNHKVLPVAGVKAGARLTLTITSWDQVRNRYRTLQSGSLQDVGIELKKTYYWGVADGQPGLSDADIKRAVEEK